MIRIAFTGSSPRGARVSGYEVHCTTSGGGVGVATTTPSTVVVVPGLTKGAPYTCQVRARSKAGPSRWSDKVLVRRSPS